MKCAFLVLMFLLLSFATICCDVKTKKRIREDITSDLGEYWGKKDIKNKRQRPDRSHYHRSVGTLKKSPLRKEFDLAEFFYKRHLWVEAHGIYYKVYKQIEKKIDHDFNDAELSNIYEGLALCTSLIRFKKNSIVRAQKLAPLLIERALALPLSDERLNALSLTSQLIENWARLTVQAK